MTARWWKARLSVRRKQAGTAAIELVMVAPVMVALILVVVAAGRFVEARQQVNDSAYAAARAVSLAPDGRSVSSSKSVGGRAARQSLGDRGLACARLQISFEGSDLRPGGSVHARVLCVADLRDVVGFGIPGSRRFTALAVVPIESYRAP